jgi:hypothetical protein
MGGRFLFYPCDRERFGGKARPAVEALIASKNLDNDVLAGPRPKSRMKEVLGAADVCVATLLPIPMFAMTYRTTSSIISPPSDPSRWESTA